MVPSLSLHDAVCNDALKQQEVLRQAGHKCEIYAEFCDPSTQAMSIDEPKLVAGITSDIANTLLIYHHAVFWASGERLLRTATCKIHLKYHNITPPNFFKGYDNGSYHATLAGIEQTKRLITLPGITRFIGDSAYNVDDLVELGVPREKTSVIAPFHKISDFSTAGESEEVRNTLNNGKINILFVGRVVPNKGHTHLIEVIDRYAHHYGQDIMLHIVGSLAMAEPNYFIHLEQLINEKRLGGFVEFKQKVDFAALHTYYKYADVFVVASEHEGFCVPLLEAQYHGLPIVALNRAAVKDTLGTEQLVIDELDYDRFAAAIKIITSNIQVRAYLAETGSANVQKYAVETLAKQTCTQVLI
jgi:glycosyltransferase involved in cell wall biosynthesis